MPSIEKYSERDDMRVSPKYNLGVYYSEGEVYPPSMCIKCVHFIYTLCITAKSGRAFF